MLRAHTGRWTLDGVTHLLGVEWCPDVQFVGLAVLINDLQTQSGWTLLSLGRGQLRALEEVLVRVLHGDAQGAAPWEQVLLIGCGQLVYHTALHLRVVEGDMAVTALAYTCLCSQPEPGAGLSFIERAGQRASVLICTLGLIATSSQDTAKGSMMLGFEAPSTGPCSPRLETSFN